jgi:UTP--glucose-1-phosphate uridylyltransferase
VVAVKDVPQEHVSRYGIVDVESKAPRMWAVRDLVENPSPETAPSTLAITGRYILTPAVFQFLERGQIGAGGEIQLTDALREVNRTEGVTAYEFVGKRYDVGEKLGFIEATLELALERSELKEHVLALMERLSSTYSTPV